MTDSTNSVFLSYPLDATSFVSDVASELRQRGLEPWFDQQARAGAAWQDELSAALEAARAVVVFIGREVSPSTNFEIGAAWGAGKPLVPVFLGAGQRHLPLVAETQGIDASNLKPDEVADRIAEALGAGSAA